MFNTKYAQMLLKTGVNLQPGQCLVIRGESVHWELATAIEAEAYKMGAKFVEFELHHLQSQVNRSRLQPEEHLDYVPDYKRASIEQMAREKWCLLRIEGMDNPDLAKEIDQKRNSVTVKAQRTAAKPLTNEIMNRGLHWCIAPAATEGWARQVGLSSKEELWAVLKPMLKLDQEDPSKAWQDHAASLKRRTEILNERKVNRLHFSGPGTDLNIFLSTKSRWSGGGSVSKSGHHFMANLPTEEVFTSPDYRKTEGKVRITRPVNLLGDQIRGAWMVFKDGALTEYGAEYGSHLLDEFLKIDPKARFLGEVALVDSGSAIFKTGKVFNSILLDENASCHIALGSGFPTAIQGSEGKTEAELDEMGCNQSLLHTDFMIGSEEISVTAYDDSGKSFPVIKDGVFAI
ncbi:MAG: hypothetical protein A2X94_07210 [Bdellovibrionales bacterium GWB1_55_8]|nr:MAG: hypothetical protein A2X94_07210 [Bdellovibrionales bacterium GWB1_55_8]